jgi:acyl-CoA thioesterase I
MKLLRSTAAAVCTSHARAAARVLLLAGVTAAPVAYGVERPTASAPSADTYTLLVLGDSISAALGIQREAGWVALLERRLEDQDRQWQVINASMSGETTGGGLARLPQLLRVHAPEVVLIELGGNDALRGYPLVQVEENLRRMTELAQRAGAVVVLAEMQIPPNYDPRNAAAFQQVFHAVADAYDAKLIPFMLEDVALEPGLMQADGIHPTAQAQPIMLDAAWPTIERALARAKRSRRDG